MNIGEKHPIWSILRLGLWLLFGATAMPLLLNHLDKDQIGWIIAAVVAAAGGIEGGVKALKPIILGRNQSSGGTDDTTANDA